MRSRHAYLARALLLILLLPALPSSGQEGYGRPPTPLPQDTGVAALKQTLRKLQTTARLMETTAHPDDEDGAMLTLESRGKGVRVLSLTLTRGEGGQNRTGSNLFDVLGVLRTLEVLASDQYYDAEQRFTHVADFGFSKTLEETLQKWQGGEPALADMVRVIRQFRPDVIVSRFQGAPRDGHGNHQAAGVLTRQAFRAAADPNQFPEQIREGLLPWQAKKLFVDNVRGNEDYSVSLDTGVVDPVLGMSYVQMAIEGLKHQQSQGVGFRTVPSGPRLSYYKLVDSVLPAPAAGTHQSDFFEGIDGSLAGLAARLGEDEGKAPFLRPGLIEIQIKIKEAAGLVEGKDASQAAMPLLQALRTLAAVLARLEDAPIRPGAKEQVLSALREKRDQLQQAVNLALGVEIHADALPDAPAPVDKPFMVAPGSSFAVRLRIANGGSREIAIDQIAFAGGNSKPNREEIRLPKNLKPGTDITGEWNVYAPSDAPYTKPYEHRRDPERDGVYIVDEPQYSTLPFPPPPFHVAVRYTVNALAICSKKGQSCPESLITVPVEARYLNAEGKTVEYPVAIGPGASVALEPGTQVLPIPGKQSLAADVRVHIAPSDTQPGILSLTLPQDWKAQPADEKVAAGDSSHTFNVAPGRVQEGAYQLKAELDWAGKRYSEGYTVVTRPDLGEFFYYQPAIQHVSAVDLKLPPVLKLGYLMGAGDDIPTVLQEAGFEVHVISPEELAQGDLSGYGTIVLGIRAYDVREDVRANNQRLLDYVKSGGTLLVQYNANVAGFNDGHYTPYPAELSRDRVTVEEAPMEILAPGDRIFHFPNSITAPDFDGWVQERGLYFMDTWDSHFEPLLACHDPGEQPLKGGLLRAGYGKGTYIYTGYAFFRQLPAGVPGAIRLFVNLVSAGHEPSH